MLYYNPEVACWTQFKEKFPFHNGRFGHFSSAQGNENILIKYRTLPSQMFDMCRIFCHSANCTFSPYRNWIMFTTKATSTAVEVLPYTSLQGTFP